jgi:hypothetical protein
MRVDPHVLTRVRRDMEKAGQLRRVDNLWIHRQVTPKEIVQARLQILRPLHARTSDAAFTHRLGQTLEIAVHRSLEAGPLDYVGGFIDLDDHDDSELYKKEEPPLRFSGRRMPGDKRFDFLAFHPSGPLGIEAKNLREWLYPDRAEVRELLEKALVSDTLPILVARRIPYVTSRLLRPCGVILFQNYNQLYPASDVELADAVRDRKNLGYHDVRTGNLPNEHLQRFLQETVPAEAAENRDRFERHKDLLADFVSGELPYAGFAARVVRRERGQPEGFDPDDRFDPNDIHEEW